jgi:hypothetical protein
MIWDEDNNILSEEGDCLNFWKEDEDENQTFEFIEE